MGSCCGRVPLARSSCCIPILWVERGILGPRWEGDCLPWLFVFGEARRLSSLLVVLAGPMLPEGPPWHPGGAGLRRRPFVPRPAGGQPGMDHPLLSGEGAPRLAGGQPGMDHPLLSGEGALRLAGGQPGIDHPLLSGGGAQDALPLPLSQAWA